MKTKLTFLLFFFICIPVYTQVAVLPMRTAGTSSLPDLPDLPDELQSAIMFLISTKKQIQLIDSQKVSKAMNQVEYNIQMPLTERRISDLCLSLKSSHIIAGDVEFFSGSRMRWKLVTASCKTKSTAARSEKIGNNESMQTLMRESIEDLLPFAADIPVSGHKASGDVDMVFVVDTSGSMAPEIPNIIQAIESFKTSLTYASRIALVLLEENNHRDIIPFTKNWNDALDRLKRVRTSGEVSSTMLEASLDTVERFKDFRNHSKVFIFSDAHTKGKRLNSLETRIRRLKKKGLEVYLFTMSGQKQEDRQEWKRLARTTGIPDPAVIYGRRIGFIQGFSIYLVMKGPSFYRVDRDVRADIQRDTIPSSDLIPIETVRYEKTHLNLNDLPDEYAKSENLKIVGMEPILSSLALQIEKAALSGSGQASSKYRVLVKSGAESFWVRIQNDGVFNKIQSYRNKTIYLGLSFHKPQGNDPEIKNDPYRIYIKDQKDVPGLLINHYLHLSKLPANKLKTDDVWFLLCEIRDIKDEGKEKDIRE